MQALGRSRGGFSTKIHMLCDGKGRPRKIILTGGEKSDCQQALPLLEGEQAQAVFADKGYDADYVLETIADMDAEAVIPPSKRRKVLRNYNIELYKQ
jgi:transposase